LIVERRASESHVRFAIIQVVRLHPRDAPKQTFMETCPVT
jgi:hypothetical protein